MGKLHGERQNGFDAAVGVRPLAEPGRSRRGRIRLATRGSGQNCGIHGAGLQMHAFHGGGDADGEHEGAVHGVVQVAVARQRRVNDFGLLAFLRHEAVSAWRPAPVGGGVSGGQKMSPR